MNPEMFTYQLYYVSIRIVWYVISTFICNRADLKGMYGSVYPSVHTSGVYRWVTGETLQYTKWDGGNPEGPGSNKELRVCTR